MSIAPRVGTSTDTSSDPLLKGAGANSRAGIERVRRVLFRHRLRLLVRIAVLAGSVAAATVLATNGYAGVGLFVAAFAVFQIPALVRFVEQPVRDLVRFLDGVRNDDLSVSFATGRGPLLDAMREALSDVVAAFRRVRSEREEQAQYLQTVVRHVGVALVGVRDDGEVALFNEAAGRLLGLRRPRTLSALAEAQPGLARTLGDVRGGRHTLVDVERDDRALTLVVQTTRFQLGGSFYTLASLQDIRPELEEKEIEAWQQLTRVLTHEIMNSVAPIASLAGTAGDMLRDEGEPSGTQRGVLEALDVIRRRCDGLIHFVEAYRSVTRLPEPSFEIVPAEELLGDVTTLLRAKAREQAVDVRLRVEPRGLELVADPDLLEQALVNVVLNAAQAVEGQPEARVEVVGRAGANGRPVIEVTDNGPGIPADVRERIFIPFFTTKQEGSGIGLSLARQIMRLHGGTLSVQSAPGSTTFSFRF